MPSRVKRPSRARRPVAAGPGMSLVRSTVARAADPALSKARLAFAGLLAKLRTRRRTLERWHAFKLSCNDWVGKRIQPLNDRLEKSQLSMLVIFDAALDSRFLSQRERKTARALVVALITRLMHDEAQGELLRLHDKYAQVSLAQQKVHYFEELIETAAEYGVDLEEFAGDRGSQEEIEEWLFDQVHAAQQRDYSHAATEEESDEPDSRDPQSERKPTTGAALESAADEAARALTQLYRRLVARIHPDREFDPKERLRKDKLLSRATLAYRAGNLLELLEIQAELSVKSGASLPEIPPGRLAEYALLLETQLAALDQDIKVLLRAASDLLEVPLTATISQKKLQAALDSREEHLEEIVSSIELDLTRFEDPYELKHYLSQESAYAQQGRDSFIDTEEEDLSGYEKPKKRRRRRR